MVHMGSKKFDRMSDGLSCVAGEKTPKQNHYEKDTMVVGQDTYALVDGGSICFGQAAWT